ncbi:voltage-gated potassium channel [Desulfosarcina sp. BuS5]|uniref:NAD-binding protein n=1 Tax=Desulfosarcina sp. BuS5 TaxID=933262 RepID=UPI0004859A94|nr:NAD-binding protein [Desulfosarcina sp. BuS5]WDN88882.1 voltage-gated potassium channel [Desulfosarcina sp. BuS5]
MIIAIGTAGYMLIEDYSLFDGIYMSIITITTVGYGEIKPLSDLGRVFTSFLILAGFASFAFAGHTFVETMLEKVWGDKLEKNKIKKKISALKSHFIICGFGRVGAAAAEIFKNALTDFIIIESDREHCEKIRQQGYLFIEGDATREKFLLAAKIKTSKGLIALLNSDPGNLFIALSARELNPTLHIIARAEDSSSEKKILRAGADSVISPFINAGKQIANNMLEIKGNFKSLDKLCKQNDVSFEWIDIVEGSEMTGETIEAVSKQMCSEIIGIRRHGKDSILPGHGTVIEVEDSILVISGKKDYVDHLFQQPLGQRKIVIVDDNPVILSLYNRLFQKAGFYPLTAVNGRDALELIIKEKPPVAVIDVMLPVFSGIEVCKKIRGFDELKNMKIVLFTADKDSMTRKRAIEAGADAVVVKSAEASEVIEKVIEVLEV